VKVRFQSARGMSFELLSIGGISVSFLWRTFGTITLDRKIEWSDIMLIRQSAPRVQATKFRRGAASLDYVLTLAVLFVMSSVIVVKSRSIMQLVYEMTCFFLAWPFM
jgi:hypothetical protein